MAQPAPKPAPPGPPPRSRASGACQPDPDAHAVKNRRSNTSGLVAWGPTAWDPSDQGPTACVPSVWSLSDRGPTACGLTVWSPTFRGATVWGPTVWSPTFRGPKDWGPTAWGPKDLDQRKRHRKSRSVKHRDVDHLDEKHGNVNHWGLKNPAEDPGPAIPSPCPQTHFPWPRLRDRLKNLVKGRDVSPRTQRQGPAPRHPDQPGAPLTPTRQACRDPNPSGSHRTSPGAYPGPRSPKSAPRALDTMTPPSHPGHHMAALLPGAGASPRGPAINHQRSNVTNAHPLSGTKATALQSPRPVDRSPFYRGLFYGGPFNEAQSSGSSMEATATPHPCQPTDQNESSPLKTILLRQTPKRNDEPQSMRREHPRLHHADHSSQPSAMGRTEGAKPPRVLHLRMKISGAPQRADTGQPTRTHPLPDHATQTMSSHPPRRPGGPSAVPKTSGQNIGPHKRTTHTAPKAPNRTTPTARTAPKRPNHPSHLHKSARHSPDRIHEHKGPTRAHHAAHTSSRAQTPQARNDLPPFCLLLFPSTPGESPQATGAAPPSFRRIPAPPFQGPHVDKTHHADRRAYPPTGL